MTIKMIASMTTLVMATLLPTAVNAADSKPKNVQYSCGVFNPSAVNATYEYDDAAQVTQVTLQYADQQWILPVSQNQPKKVVFSNTDHQWTVAKPHPTQQNAPMNSGELAEIKTHAAKGRVFAVAQKIETSCFTEVL